MAALQTRISWDGVFACITRPALSSRGSYKGVLLRAQGDNRASSQWFLKWRDGAWHAARARTIVAVTSGL